MPYFGVANGLKDQSGASVLSGFKLYGEKEEEKEADINDIFAAIKGVAKQNDKK